VAGSACDAEEHQQAFWQAEKRRAREHGAVPLLVPDYLNALEKAGAHRADLEAQYKAATAKPSEDEEEPDDDVSAETLSPTDANQGWADE
jgi:type I restriction enzyme M protein